jgi:hypothetical protein
MRPVLVPGIRVRLGGGYDMEPEWMCGRDWHCGTFEVFMPGQGDMPAAVVRLDEPITVRGLTGSVVVLELRYVGAEWRARETVHVELCDFEPEPVPWPRRRQGKRVESHATIDLERPQTEIEEMETRHEQPGTRT